jgi:peptidoglycan/LPS O-acetylase OafA/YrhL
MLFHFSTELKLHVLHMAYLAVDFFFLLSGFVIAHAYEKRLASDLGFKTFAVQRVIRLYPMYIMGLLLALIPTILASEIGLPHQSRIPLTISFLFGMLFLPTPSGVWPHAHQVFPINGPAWSLSTEMGINLVYAAVLKYLSDKHLIALAIISAMLLVSSQYLYNGLGGDTYSDYLSGWIRVTFAFPAGVLLYRIFERRRSRPALRGAFPLSALLLISIFALRTYSLILMILAIFIVFPTVIWICADVQLGKMSNRVSRWLGEVSYPLYIIHIPILSLISAVDHWMYGQGAHPYLKLTIYALLTLATARALNVFFDLPIRARLRAALFASPA